MDINDKKNLKLRLLIIRAQAGCIEAFKELYIKFNKLTYRYVKAIIDSDEIDDVQQQVWFSVYKNISKLETPNGFKSWLFVIARRAAIDYCKKRRLYEERFLDSEEYEFEAEYESNEYTQIRLSMDQQVNDFISKLSVKNREVIVLHYWQGFSCSDISKIIGCSEGTVKSRLFTARRTLESFKLNNIIQ